MLGEDGKPFKTREGGTVPLADLLDEAIVRARAVIDAKSPELPDAERAAIARTVGIGAVKYADLSSEPPARLLFSFDRMLALDGNTAPYLQYAHVRAGVDRGPGGGRRPRPSPRWASRPSARSPSSSAASASVIDDVVETLEPHRLCTYLYEVAGAFTTFYEACPVLKAEPAARASRLALCELTARTLQNGLSLLGIGVPERM